MLYRPYRPLPGPLRRGEKFPNRRGVLVNKYEKFEGVLTLLRGENSLKHLIFVY